MSQLHGKQIRNSSTSLEKLNGTGIVEFTNATMSFTTGSVLTTEDINIINGVDVVNKNYVDSVAQGLDVKESVRFTTISGTGAGGYNDIGGTYGTANNGTFTNIDFTNTSIFDLDTHISAIGDRVLVKNQTIQSENGIYEITTAGETGEMTRAEDADGLPEHEVSLGNFTFVEYGLIKGSTGWILSTSDATNPDEISVGVDTQVWIQFSSAGVIQAGDGLTKTANTLDVNTGVGLEIDISNDVRLSDTAVTAGSFGDASTVSTYTVDQQGRLTASGEVSIDITSSQVSDFNTASETAIFTDVNFVDSDSIDFDVTAGESVTADVKIDGVTASGLTVSINGLSVNVDGTTIIVNNTGQLEVDSSAIVPDVSNGLSIDGVSSDIILGGTLSQDTTISGNSDYSIIFDSVSTFDVMAEGFVSIDAGTGSIQFLADGDVSISGLDSVNLVSDNLSFTFDSGSVTDDSGDGFGLVYTADYSGTFVTNSLITKQYVDDLIQVINDDFITAIEVGPGLTVSSGTEGTASISILDSTAGDGLTFTTGVYDVNTGLGLEIVGDDVAMVWGGTSTGLTFSMDAVKANVDGSTIVINNDGQLEVSIDGFKSVPVYQLSTGVTSSGSTFSTGVLLTATPSQYSRVQVFVNGLNLRVGSGTASASTSPVYFENGSIREINDLDTTCQLIWNGDFVGYQLEANDEIEIVYEA